jgi:MFS family permease
LGSRLVTLLCTNRSFRLVTLVGFLDALANSALYIFVPLVLSDSGAEPALAAAVVSAFFVSSLFGKVLGGRLADRFGLSLCLACCQLGCGLVLFALSGASSTIAVAVLVVLLGAVSKASLPVVLSATAESLPPSMLRLGFGLNQTLLGLATTLSPILLGVSGAQLGAAGGLSAAVIVCMFAAIVSAACFRSSRRQIVA